MSRTVWKYSLSITEGTQSRQLPILAKTLHVGIQEPGQIQLWAEVDPSQKMEQRVFMVFGTGQVVPDQSFYTGTVQDGSLVWHLYELL